MTHTTCVTTAAMLHTQQWTLQLLHSCSCQDCVYKMTGNEFRQLVLLDLAVLPLLALKQPMKDGDGCWHQMGQQEHVACVPSIAPHLG